MTLTYTTETGYYILVDSEGRIGAKANVPVGEHPCPSWVDIDESFDVDSADELQTYDIDPYYRDGV